MAGLKINKGVCPKGRSTSPGVLRAVHLAAVLIMVLLAGGSVSRGQAGHLTDRIVPPDGFRASDVPETYGPDTLYQKINGQAEFYLSAGFVSLESRWYEAVGDASTIIEVNLYHMGSLVNAFSVFSRQRRDAAQTIDVTLFAYQTDSAIYMAHGPYYVEMVSTLPPGTGISLLKQLAEQFVRSNPVGKEDLPLLALFPLENLVKGSAAMIAGDAFGFELLDNVFTVDYNTEVGRATAYVSRRKTAEEARVLAGELHKFFAQYGGRPVETGIAVEGVRMIEIMGAFEVMFTYGEYLAGVHEAPARKQAERIAVCLAGSLKEKTGESSL